MTVGSIPKSVWRLSRLGTNPTTGSLPRALKSILANDATRMFLLLFAEVGAKPSDVMVEARGKRHTRAAHFVDAWVWM
ncbi:MAG TPA: hypothetical protein VFT34_00645 [Verrucomicrobiae bacterium]|nr:hypothetical protein [Verrucomicrobiae bacterium]